MYIEIPFISSHMAPMYIETPYISSQMRPIYIEALYICVQEHKYYHGEIDLMYHDTCNRFALRFSKENWDISKEHCLT